MSIDVPGGATSKHEHGASLDLLSRAFYPKKSPMPANSFLEEITLENSALLLIDHQVGTNLVDGAQTDLEFRDAVRALVGAAKNYDIPTLITDSVPQGLNDNTVNWITQLYPDHKVYHRDGAIDAFAYKPFADAVAALGRKKLIITGVTGDACGIFPARSALRLGYDVIYAYDAAAAVDKLSMIATMLRMQQMGAIVAPWYAIAAEWEKNLNLTDGSGLGKAC